MAGLGLLLICVGVIFVAIGAVIAASQAGERLTASAASEPLRPISATARRPAIAPRRVERQPPPVRARSGNTMSDHFFRARLGQTVVFNHPQRGPITGKILGSIHYTELWQRVNSPKEPWVPTGNTFAAHWFGSHMLYEWQTRLYVLDEIEPLSEADINTQFLPHARRFAQSGQTAQVTFAWPPASWTIVDIGKFSVAKAEGAGLRLTPGAEGRFIHARGADNRALVVEDYQGGSGGQDTAWIGWELSWTDLQKIE